MIRLALGAAVVLALLSAVAPTAGAAATPAWAKLADPPVASPHGIATFGAAGVVVAGTGGALSVSTNGGANWSSPSSGTTVDLNDVAFNDANHGWAVGPAGAILITTNGGATWNPPTSVSVDLSAINLNGVAFSDANHGWAVGAAGTIVATTDGGATWNPQTSNVTADLNGVAFKDANNGWAVGAAGTILATTDGGATWNPVTTAPITQDLGGAAYLGAPRPQLLVGGAAGLLERYVVSSDTWASDNGALGAAIVSCAAGPGGIAYALSSDGHVERTLSYGAAPLALSASATALRAGQDVHLTVSSPIRAVGTLYLDDELAGGAWKQLTHWSWRANPAPATPGVVIDSPLSNTLYRLRFVFAGKTAATSAPVTVGVHPLITLNHGSFTLRKGATYRLSGHVFPTETGRKVTIWTNRGGTWRKVASGGTVALVHGTTFTTRLFGTPVRESYKLQVRLSASPAYLAATSAMVRVTIK